MVVDDEASSIAIMQGDYNAGLVTSAEDSANQYIAPFNRCVASVKLKQFEKAEADCTEAISLLKEIKASRFKRNELTSFALSNRGVARFMANNDTAAIADFYETSRLDDNEYVSFNLNRAKQELKLLVITRSNAEKPAIMAGFFVSALNLFTWHKIKHCCINAVPVFTSWPFTREQMT